jgi:hypothetical protein
MCAGAALRTRAVTGTSSADVRDRLAELLPNPPQVTAGEAVAHS